MSEESNRHSSDLSSPGRKLAAILFADIQGYTALMQQNEAEGLRKAERFRQVLKDKVGRHDGEILQHYGDGSLVIFSSGVAAVQCAKEIQQSLQQAPQVPLRIGIHIGDIVVKGNDIYGDGVNLASRVESIGVPGSVLFTQRIIPDLKSHPEFKTVSLGSFHFKNVTEPMEVFALANEGLAIPKKGEIKGKLQQKASNNYFQWLVLATLGALVLVAGLWIFSSGNPAKTQALVSDNSVAVLPFDNMNKDEEGELFCDGMMEDVLTYLSRIRDLKVISRTSAMQYKNSTKKTPEIAQELGVAHIVEGSVRKYGNKARITVQLIRALDDQHLWADSYDRDLQDIFAVQSEVAQQIVQALQLKISTAESQSLQNTAAANPEAYQLYLKGKRAADDRTEAGMDQSEQLLRSAIALDSNFASAYANLGYTLFLQERYAYKEAASTNLESEQLALKAISLDEQSVDGFSVLGGVFKVRGNYPQALEAFEKALNLGPNQAITHHAMGQYYGAVGEYEKELGFRRKAVELDPLLLVYHRNLIEAFYETGRLKEAKEHLEKTRLLFPEGADQLNRYNAWILFMEGNFQDAIPIFETELEKRPWYRKTLGYCYARNGQREKAIDIMETLSKEPQKEFYRDAAIIYAGLHEAEKVLQNLEQATQLFIDDVDQSFGGLDQLWLYQTALKKHPYFESIRTDARFKAILQKLQELPKLQQ